MKNLSIILLILFFISCKEERVFTKSKVDHRAFTWTKPVSNDHSSQIAKSYEESLKIKPANFSDIDSLISEKEVQDFIRKQDTNYDKFELESLPSFKANNQPESIIKIIAKNQGINKSFYKYDIDGNGLTDIIAFAGGKSTIALMNFGKQKIVKQIDMYHIEPVVVKIIPARKSRLKVYTVPSTRWEYGKPVKPTSVELTFRENAFVEFNDDPTNKKINKIEFAASMCFGTCPDFQLTLNKNNISYFIAKHYNFNQQVNKQGDVEEGFFKGKINDKDFERIEDAFNYIDFENLKSEYYISATDMPSVTVVITYDNGKVKKIYDYGLRGTYGLHEVYKMLFSLRFTQKWIETKEVLGVRMKDVF